MQLFEPNKTTAFDRTKAIATSNATFMSRVYLWMMTGIFITGVTAYFIASRTNIVSYLLQNNVLFIGLIIAQFAAVIGLTTLINRMSVMTAAITYALYATLTGLTFSVIFLIYTAESISTAFFVTSFAFAGLSGFGYVTKRDLGPIGSFCTIGLFGLVAVMFLGLFFPSLMSNSVQLATSVLGVVIFAGLTAYDTQRIKSLNIGNNLSDENRKGAIYGALILYLDFINLFLNLLRLFGRRN